MNDVKDTLLHAVSHDLKGPLAGIIGAMSTLRRGNELQLTGDEVESLYQMIEQSGRKMNRLIDDMLDLERLDRGQVQPEREPTDVGEMVRRVAREAPGMDTHPVRIDGEQVLANVDPAKVERIVENLLVNAARHTPPGSTIELRLRAQGRDAVVEVADDGPGVPEQLREQIFERFVRGDGPADTAVAGGSGLGLAIVRAVAVSHGGSAEVGESERGGALFRVRLPLRQADAERGIEPALDRL